MARGAIHLLSGTSIKQEQGPSEIPLEEDNPIALRLDPGTDTLPAEL